MSHPDGSRVNTGGRSIPRECGPPVAHEIRYAPQLLEDDCGDCAILVASCGHPACDYRLVMTELYYTRPQLNKLADGHEGRTP